MSKGILKAMSSEEIKECMKAHACETEPGKIERGYTVGNTKILINRSNVVVGSSADKKNLEQIEKILGEIFPSRRWTVTRT